MLALEVPKRSSRPACLHGATSGRADDADPAVIQKRIDVYNAETAPVADHYRAAGKYQGIDGVDPSKTSRTASPPPSAPEGRGPRTPPMASQNFVDYVKICCRSGKGGQGSTHMHRDKTTSKGGPDGGDGGRGGHVIIRGNSQLWTLLHLKYQRHVIAEHGEPGSGNRRHGADGNDAVIEVPLGTLVKDAETGEVQAEITEHGQEIIATPRTCWLGNDHFKSSTNQAPR